MHDWYGVLKRRFAYAKHELGVAWHGDTRTEYERLVAKCRILRLNVAITDSSRAET